MPPQVPQNALTDRIALQIESLQESYRSLSAAATVKDMAAKFVAVVRGAYPSSEISLFYRGPAAAEWQTLSGTGMGNPADFLALPDDRAAVVSTRNEASTSIHIIQRLVDRSHAAILLAQNPPGTPYTDADVISLRLFVHLFDNAYHGLVSRRNEKDLIFSLNHRLLQLNSLIDTGIEVARLDEEVSPEHLALERAASLTNASKGAVTVARKNGGTETFSFPAGVPGQPAMGGTHRIATAFAFADNTYTFELFDKESRSGVLPFDETDQLLLDALARQVHASLENRYLHQQQLEKQKIEQDIAVAGAIQKRILPISLPTIKGYDIAGINIPSKSVGGDYYDCIPLPDGKYALIIADVAGKGVPAALLVSSLHAYLSAYLESSMPLIQLAQRLNTVICHASPDDKFITAFIALLSPETGEIESLNAGHNPAYWLKNDSTIQELSTGGVAFGMLDMDFPYQSEHVTIGQGERLLLYTDGVTEATNEHSQLYDSLVPLHEFVVQHKPDRAELFIRDLITDIKRFTGNASQNDDITALYLVRR